MSFFQNPSFYLQTAEADIVSFFQKAEAEVTVLEQDFLNVLSWVQQNAAEIGTLITGLIGVAVGTAGGSLPTALISAQSALASGMNLLNAAVAAANQQKSSGGSVNSQTVSALAAAYAQFKSVQSQAATVAGTVASPASAAS